MNLGAALNPRLDVFEQVEAFAQAGFSYVDFGFDFPLTAETFDAGRFRDALLENGLALHGQTPAHLPFGSPYPTIREQAVAVAQKTLNVLESLGAKTVIVHPDGAFWFQEAFEEWNLASFQAVAAFRKTPLLLENLPEKPFHTLAGLSNLLNKTGCALNVDVGHCHVAGERVLEEFLASGLVRHAHVSDNDGKTDGHLALGHGTLDLGRAKAALDNARVPDVTIESYAGGMQGVLSSKKAWDAL